ncbi:MAG: TatD family hydrolase, partial [Candidatus Hodarchaeales archaeon]
MFDSHAHLLPDFMKNVDEVVKNAINSNVKYIINSAIEPHQIGFALSLEDSNKNFIYSTIGFAPQRIKNINLKESISAIKNNESIVAVGEIGLDYHWI